MVHTQARACGITGSQKILNTSIYMSEGVDSEPTAEHNFRQTLYGTEKSAARSGLHYPDLIPKMKVFRHPE